MNKIDKDEIEFLASVLDGMSGPQDAQTGDEGAGGVGTGGRRSRGERGPWSA